MQSVRNFRKVLWEVIFKSGSLKVAFRWAESFWFTKTHAHIKRASRTQDETQLETQKHYYVLIIRQSWGGGAAGWAGWAKILVGWATVHLTPPKFGLHVCYL